MKEVVGNLYGMGAGGNSAFQSAMQSFGGPQMAGRLQMQSPPINPSQMSTDAALATSAALRRG